MSAAEPSPTTVAFQRRATERCREDHPERWSSPLLGADRACLRCLRAEVVTPAQNPKSEEPVNMHACYVCPTTGETECIRCGGFDNCCEHPRCPGNRSADVELVFCDPSLERSRLCQFPMSPDGTVKCLAPATNHALTDTGRRYPTCAEHAVAEGGAA